MKTMKNGQWLVVALVLITAVVAGCGGGGQPKQEKFPTGPISVIVAFAPGGATDLGARLLAPIVEKELGVPVTIVNKSGSGGWIGWTEMLRANTDGYTIGYINTPGLMAGYLNPSLKNNNNLESFDFIANHVLDYGAIAINSKEKRFTDIKSLIEYAKTNNVTGVSTGVANDEHVAMLRLNKLLGTRFVPVHTKGAGDGKSSVMGGHIDVFFANVGDVTTAHQDKEMKVIAVMAPERSKFLPDVPTLDEAGYKGIYGWASRGIFAKKGIPKDRLDKITAAFEKAINDPAHVKKMTDMGLQVKFMKGQEYKTFLKSDEDLMKSVSDLLGWKDKK